MTYKSRLRSFENRKWVSDIEPHLMAKAGFAFHPLPHAPDNVECFMCGVRIKEWADDDDPIVEHLHHSPDCEYARVIGDEHHTLDDRLATFADWPLPQDSFRATPLTLAQAGFFYNPEYVGDDTVQCAFCEHCFTGWQPWEDPLECHQDSRPDCEHIRQYDTSSLTSLASLGPIPVLQPTNMQSKRLLSITGAQPSAAILTEYEQEPAQSSVAVEVEELSIAEAGSDSELVDVADPVGYAVISDAVDDSVDPEPTAPDSLPDTPEKRSYQGSTTIYLSMEQSTAAAVQAGSPIRSCETSQRMKAEQDSDCSKKEIFLIDSESEASRFETIEQDPETPQDDPKPANTPERSVPIRPFNLKAFTSTPIVGRLSPNKMLAQTIPSPLPGINPARTSFEPQDEPSMPLYPTMPSFPEQSSSALFSTELMMHAQLAPPASSSLKSGAGSFDPCTQEDTEHDIEENDHSTPSPTRSPLRSSMIASETVDMCSPLPQASPPQAVKKPISLKIKLCRPSKAALLEQLQPHIAAICSKTMVGAESSNVRAWQAQLAEEVDCAVRAINSAFIAQINSERERVLAQVREQYGVS